MHALARLVWGADKSSDNSLTERTLGRSLLLAIAKTDAEGNRASVESTLERTGHLIRAIYKCGNIISQTASLMMVVLQSTGIATQTRSFRMLSSGFNRKWQRLLETPQQSVQSWDGPNTLIRGVWSIQPTPNRFPV